MEMMKEEVEERGDDWDGASPAWACRSWEMRGHQSGSGGERGEIRESERRRLESERVRLVGEMGRIYGRKRN